MSSCAETSDAASSSVRSKRTFHEPFASRARKRFQPCAVGVMKTGGDAASMTNTPSTSLLAKARPQRYRRCSSGTPLAQYESRYRRSLHSQREKPYLLKEIFPITEVAAD